MAYDPNFNSGNACKNPIVQEAHSTDFGWYQNEESLDLSSYMTSGQNLELCNDDLFQNLFPPNSPTLGADLKKEDLSHFNDEEVEEWYQNTTSGPASACTSTTTSPVPLNCYNTPPVTPQTERYRPQSPHHLQFDGLTTPMSSSRFASLRAEEGNTNYNMSMRQIQTDTQNHHGFVKQEPEMEQQPLFSSQIAIKQERQATVPCSAVTGIPTDVNQSSSQVKHLIKRPAPYNTNTTTNKKSKMPLKGTDEYVQKRQRNNVAVRRSRDKAKMKAQETQKKVDELFSENSQLHKRVSELTNELTTLKGLLRGMPRVNTQNV